REARDGGLAGAADAGEEEGAAVTDGAGGVGEEAALAGEDERVDDAQHGVDRVGVGGLADEAAAGGGAPCGEEVAAREGPERAAALDAHVVIGGEAARRSEVDVELVVMFEGGRGEAGVAVLEEAEEGGIVRVNGDGDAADAD